MGVILYLLLQDLPLIIPTGAILFVAVNFLIPNPRKHGKLAGWFFAELVEHVALPFAFLFALYIARGYTLVLLYPFTLLLYGKVFGNAKTLKDWFRTTFMYFAFILVIAYPQHVMHLDSTYGIPGWTIHVAVTTTALTTYYFARKKRTGETMLEKTKDEEERIF